MTAGEDVEFQKRVVQLPDGRELVYYDFPTEPFGTEAARRRAHSPNEKDLQED